VIARREFMLGAAAAGVPLADMTTFTHVPWLGSHIGGAALFILTVGRRS